MHKRNLFLTIYFEFSFMYLSFIFRIYSHARTIRWRGTTGPAVGMLAEPEMEVFITIFPVRFNPRTMETGKTIERQARGSLSLLNNFCVLKFNRAPCSIGDAFVVRVVGRGDTISALEQEFHRMLNSRSPVLAIFDGTKRPGSNYFVEIYRLSALWHGSSPRKIACFNLVANCFSFSVFLFVIKKYLRNAFFLRK